MLPEIKGRQLLDVLADLNEPASLTDIARHVANDLDIPEPKGNQLKTIKSALDAGVRYGYIEKNDYFYSLKDAEDDDIPPRDSDSDSNNSVDSLPSVKNSRAKESETSKAQPDQRKQLATTVKEAKNKTADVETMSSDCNDNRRGMQRRRAGEKRRRSRSRSNRSARKSSRRRR